MGCPSKRGGKARQPLAAIRSSSACPTGRHSIIVSDTTIDGSRPPQSGRTELRGTCRSALSLRAEAVGKIGNPAAVSLVADLVGDARWEATAPPARASGRDGRVAVAVELEQV